MKKIIYLLPMLLLLSACGGNYIVKDGKEIPLNSATKEGYEQALEKLENLSEAQLIEQWGVPNRSYEVDGKKYLLYITEEISASFSDGTGDIKRNYCNTTFTIEKGIVIKSKYSGKLCARRYKVE